MQASREDMVKAFKNAGYRLTRQREAIFGYLAGREGEHPSARQIFDDIKGTCRGLSVATVYNTMGTLAGLGIVKVIEFETGDNRYEKNLEPHINLVCTTCGTIQDFDVGPDIHVRCAREKAGFRVDDFRLEYYGRCSACEAEKEAAVAGNRRS